MTISHRTTKGNLHSMTKLIGVLTAGGDTPGLNAALRGLGKSALESYGMQLLGFYDGFRGLMQNRYLRLDESALSGILTIGGTILGTSRDKPHKMPVGDKVMDMTTAILDTYRSHHLDVLVCIGGGGTQKSALRLMKKGMNIITLPKTIDNDVAGTDVTFGFDTALGVATEAIDRLHSTAHSHHRIVVVETMGHNAGWLALGAGIAGGADVILIPEIPYDVEVISEAILHRSRGGKRFSIVAVSEGAVSKHEFELLSEKEPAADEMDGDEEDLVMTGRTMRLARKLEELTGLESRVTILGYLQRGGAPSAADRLLATRLGTATADLIAQEKYGVMVAAHGEEALPMPLEEVAGKRRTVPLDHPWVESARRVGTCLGDA
jgi:phosphofructokinase-like protein